MLKKISFIIILIITIFSFNNIVKAECTYNPNTKDSYDTSTNLMGCLEGGDNKLVTPKFDLKVEKDFKSQILEWITNIAGFLGLIAVSALVYAAFMMTISGGEEEKVKKAKDIVKWALLGFLGIVTASSLIAIVINFMYSF